LLNVALASSLVWSELFPAGVRSLVWVSVLVIWVGSAVFSYRKDGQNHPPQDASPLKETFAVALDHYLKGNWFESEHVLQKLLVGNPRDVDVRLMLATAWRRAGRFSEAATQLDQIECLDGSDKWELEIDRERRLIHQGRTEQASEPAAADPPAEVPDAA
jgi:thioredoxin-like negative regulator of GroEL